MLKQKLKELKALIKTNKQTVLALAIAVIASGVFIPSLIAIATNPSETFYYILSDEEQGYLIEDGNGGLSGKAYTVATSTNAIYQQVIVPRTEAFCSWQVITVHPDLTVLGAVPIATSSTSSKSGLESEIVEHPVYLRVGETYLVKDLRKYANSARQFAMRPEFHPQQIQVVKLKIVNETASKISYQIEFSNDVKYFVGFIGQAQTQSSTIGKLSTFTVSKPARGTSNQLLIEAYYECPSCGQTIQLADTDAISVPYFYGDNGNGGENPPPNPTPEPEPGSNEKGSSGSSGNIITNTTPPQEIEKELLSIQYSGANGNGWYKNLPELMMKTESGYQIYYQVWNTSLKQEREQVPVLLYRGQQLFSQDGINQCVIWVESENSDTRLEETFLEFKIDRVAPQIMIQYQTDNISGQSYHQGTVTAMIIIDEINFSEQDTIIKQSNGIVSDIWVHKGTTHMTTVMFKEDGLGILDVISSDLAGHTTRLTEEKIFVIDTKPPTLTITGVDHLTANRTAVSPMVIYGDENLDYARSKIVLESYQHGEIKGKRMLSFWEGNIVYTFDPIEEDDNYILTAQIYDKAGNQTEQLVSFSVNQKGATFVFTNKEIIGKYTNQSFYPAIEVWTVDEMTVVSATLNGQDVDYVYQDGVVTFANLIEADGKYIVGLEVKDTAGNHSMMEPVEFFFDNTKPVNVIQGVIDGAVYHTPITILIQTEQRGDMIKEITLNGQQLEDYKIDDNGIVTLKIPEIGDYTLTVASVDLAGNVSDTAPISFSYQMTNDMVRKSGNSSPYFGVVIAVAVFSGAGLYFISRRLLKRRHKEAITK